MIGFGGNSWGGSAWRDPSLIFSALQRKYGTGVVRGKSKVIRMRGEGGELWETKRSGPCRRRGRDRPGMSRHRTERERQEAK
mmetsp:Transcript_7112/g.15002  ORF Transcript_7112/g.15002 Transcript_7112/m.15002 type:complete len:82 (+) Transcript_7112:41-286(+)